MRLSRMGSFHASRLSFGPTLLRTMEQGGWRVDRPVFDLDERGAGQAIYRVKTPAQTLCLACFSHDLPDEERSDRVIATRWDATFALTRGWPEMERLAESVPWQEARRVSEKELTLSRANRSARVFDNVVSALERGLQPDPELLAEVGYLMRTTAVYGSAKFGTADRGTYAQDVELSPPFRAEMLTVWLIRAFTFDLADHLAHCRGGTAAAELSSESKALLGVGNATGLGMAPFLVAHPLLLHRWMLARETALARIRTLPKALDGTAEAFGIELTQALRDAAEWRSDHPMMRERLADLRTDLALLANRLHLHELSGPNPWNDLFLWAEAALSEEGQERLVSLLLDVHAPLVDDLAPTMSAPAPPRLDGRWTVGRLLASIRDDWAWALEIDWGAEARTARFWYTSEEKLEPRLGQRHEEPGSDLERPLAIGRDVATLADALERRPEEELIARFLLDAPEHRLAAHRVQLLSAYPYSEIRDNLIDAETLPIDMLRSKLAMFGATRFDPRSDRWVRVRLFEGAPGLEAYPS